MAKQELITPAGRSCYRRRSLVFSFFFLCEFLLFLISFSSFLILCHRRLILYCFCILYDWCFCNQTACKPKIAAAEGHCVKNKLFCNSCSFWFVWRKHCLFLKYRHLPSGLCEGPPSVPQVSSSSVWFVWRKPVCFSSLVIFLLVCVDKTCLFLKSRHLPSGLCEENLSVSRVSSSSFWFVWRKRSLFLNYRLKFPSTIQIGEIRSV
jgi:hypothetical protein